MKLWLTIPEYMKKTNLSRPVVTQLIEEGQLVTTKTEGGQWRIKGEEEPELIALKEEIVELRSMMTVLCSHLGVKTT